MAKKLNQKEIKLLARDDFAITISCTPADDATLENMSAEEQAVYLEEWGRLRIN